MIIIGEPGTKTLPQDKKLEHYPSRPSSRSAPKSAPKPHNTRGHGQSLFGGWRRGIAYSWRKTWGASERSRLDLSLALDEPKLSRLMRLTVITLVCATFGFCAWAALTSVKEVVRAEGQVVPSGYTRLVQHLEGGLVEQIMVHEGDYVKEGQILMVVDGAGSEQDKREQELLVESLSLQQERLQALLNNRQPDFSAITTNTALITEQTKMYNSARDYRLGEVGVLNQQIQQRQDVIRRLKQESSTAQSSLDIAAESYSMYQKLAETGNTTKVLLLRRKEEYNAAKGQVDSLRYQINEAEGGLNEYRQRQQTLEEQQRDAIYTELHKVEGDLAQSKETLEKRQKRVDRLELRAPVDGYVKGLKINTIGAVIPAGQTVMEVVPAEEQLIVEVKIMPQQIGRVSIGQEVQVKVDSYDYVRFGMLTGKLELISATTFTDEAMRKEYFKGRVFLDHNYLGKEPGKNLVIPGMTVESEIVIGEKSVLAYLLKPVRNAMSNAMTEH